MGLPGEVGEATPSLLGFDSDTVISAALAHQFFAGRYKFCLRYLSLAGQEPPRTSALRRRLISWAQVSL